MQFYCIVIRKVFAIESGPCFCVCFCVCFSSETDKFVCFCPCFCVRFCSCFCVCFCSLSRVCIRVCLCFCVCFSSETKSTASTPSLMLYSGWHVEPYCAAGSLCRAKSQGSGSFPHTRLAGAYSHRGCNRPRAASG